MLPWPHRLRIHLATMTDGAPHPAAQIMDLSYTFVPGYEDLFGGLDMSITGSRLAVLRWDSRIRAIQVVVWDWTTGQILLVRRSLVFDSALMGAAC